MGFPANWITLLLVSACTLMVHGQDNTQTRIPDSLIECYRNLSLRNPENRLPMNIHTFIDIVRKVERYQRGTVDILGVTTSILHSFRLDGIERSPGVVESDGVLPFAVRGVPFYKHRLVLRYLVPSNNYQFPNESLSQVELCTLHFMLSHTIDVTPRGDEATVCRRLSDYVSGNRVPRNARFRRQVEQDEAAAKAAEEQKSEEGNSDLKDAEEIKVGDTGKGLQEDSDKNSENTSNHDPKDTDEPNEAEQKDHQSETTQKEQAEVIQASNGNGTMSGNYVWDDDMQRHNFQHQKARNVVDPEIGPDVQERATVSTTESDCPVEGGAVYTKWGTVSLGTVLAGLAAGMFPERVPTATLLQIARPSVNLPSDLAESSIDNKFAATLVGDLAEAALVQGPKRPNDIKIGLLGAWNSTIIPRWYFNKEQEGREMTDAEIRGGLDGLVMGTYIAEWKQHVPDGELRLSQLLSMYYSEDGAFSPQYRACQRKDSYSEVAPNNELQDQAYAFALILDHYSFTTASVDSARVRTFAENAVGRLSSYIPGMDDKPCSPRQNDTQGVSLYTNVTVVIDKNWPFEDIKSLLYQLAVELELSEHGSRLTVLDGKNAAAFITDATLSLDFFTNFTRFQYDTHEGGMDIPRLLEQELLMSKEGLLNAESEDRLAGGRSKVVLFIPQTPVSLNNNDLTIARDKINHFRRYLPDVKFLYLAPGSRNNYVELVDNPTNDIISFVSLETEIEKSNAVSDVIDRIKRVPLRLFNPTCGADWKGADYDTGDFVHSVKLRGVNYHRLHPNYFFGVGSAQVTVLGSNSQDMTVCFSRRVEFPTNATNGVTCSQTQNGNVEINLGNGCEGIEFVSQCPPLYISVRPTPITIQPFNCRDGCVNPTDIQYTVRNQRLGCTAGVGHLLSNRQLIFLPAVMICLMKYLKFGS